MSLTHTVVEGDCMKVLPDFPTESADAFVTDPPYGINNNTSTRRKNKEDQFQNIQNDERPFVWWLYDAYRITKEGGNLICFCRWDVQEAFRQAIVWAGFTIRSHVIWDRDMHGLGDLEGQFAPQHDVIWYASKGKAQLYGLRPKSVIRIPRLHSDQLRHPNEKPLPLMRYLVRAVSPVGGMVVDPFGGSGSTAKACQMEGRSCVTVEIDPGYAALCRRELATAQGTMDLQEASHVR